MAINEKDLVSGHETTGHEWNGIKELDTPVPRGVLIFLVVTHRWAIAWWFLAPTWPLGTTYTKGLLGIDQRQIVERKLLDAQAERSAWMGKVEKAGYDEVMADEKLMQSVLRTGRQLFGDNCAACHGIDGRGRANYPDLTDGDWLWGNGPEAIAETMRVGINTQHPKSRVAQMPSFGIGGMLDTAKVRNVAAYVYALSRPDYSTPENLASIQAGREVFLANCAACHGEEAKGNRDMGAPNLTDAYWIYGGDMQTIVSSVHGGRQGHMPTWDERLTEAEIKILALYVHSLGIETP